MSGLLSAWDTLSGAVLRVLRKAPEDRRIIVAIIVSHEAGNVTDIEIQSNVPQLTAIQAIQLASTGAVQRPDREPGEDLLPTLVPSSKGISMKLICREFEATVRTY